MSNIFAIVVAAGEGERLKRSLIAPSSGLVKGSFFEPNFLGGKSKVNLELADGLSILDCALNNLWQSAVFTGVVIVAREADIFDLKEYYYGNELFADSFAAHLEIVKGGASRQESVLNGLEAIKDRADFVAIHDGARPFCSPDSVKSVLMAAKDNGAALLASRLVSTIKRQAEPDIPTVKETVWRGDLWEAQTPQAFEFKLIYDAHLRAVADGRIATDDAELVEKSGLPVAIIENSRMNFKITTADDFRLAMALFEDFRN